MIVRCHVLTKEMLKIFKSTQIYSYIVQRMYRHIISMCVYIIIYTTQYIPSYFSNPAVAVTVSNPAKMATFLMTFMTQHSEELVRVVYFTDQPS